MKNLSLQSHLELFGVENHPFVQYVVLNTIASNICKNDSIFHATVCKLLHNQLLSLVLHEQMKNLSLQPHLQLFGVENHPFVQYVVLNTIACNICKNDSKFNATVCKLLHNELLRLVLHEKMKNLSLQPHLELFGVENHPFVQYVVLNTIASNICKNDSNEHM